MNYEETLDFLFNRLQSFHNKGAAAYKPGLEKAFRLSETFGSPHTKFRSIHIGGTNGKGSTAHSIASVLQSAGYKVGLYTSPHLVDFRERIRINGVMISEDEVIDFVRRFRENPHNESLDPSFFVLTTIMAFEHFARNNVDFAVIEVGLGGRLDTTNIITPVLSVITNVSYDHTDILGKTLPEIAREKAGIIKPDVPVVIGRRNPETDMIFSSASPFAVFAEDTPLYNGYEFAEDSIIYHKTPWGNITSCLTGLCQPENFRTILNALKLLTDKCGVAISENAVKDGLRNVCLNTGLMGRWMKISDKPLVIADTAHNVDGWTYIAERLNSIAPHSLHVVIGFVNDKDYNKILSLLPKKAYYYFVRPSVARAANENEVLKAAKAHDINGKTYSTVIEGYNNAIEKAKDNEDALIYVGGSTFVVADLLTSMASNKL